MSAYSTVEYTREEAIDAIIYRSQDNLKKYFDTFSNEKLEQILDELLEPSLLNCVIVEKKDD